MRKMITALITTMLFFVFVPMSQAADDISGHWAEEQMRELVEHGILSGDGTGAYRPNDSVTRAEFAKLVIETLNFVSENKIQGSATNVPPLSDLKPGEWYYEYVIAAMGEGIISGFDDGTFGPGKEITRDQMATMVMRAINSRNIPSHPAPLNFKDKSQIPKYALDYVQRIVSLGIMTGTNDGSTFAPAKTSTRAEAASVLVRMIKLFNGESEPIVKTTAYNITLNEMVTKQMNLGAQTDKYRNDPAYVSGDYIIDIVEEDGKTYGFITPETTFLNVREGASIEYRQVGKLTNVPENPTKVEILDTIVNSKEETWFMIKYGAWRNAKTEDVMQYANPSNFSAGTKEYLQFLVLSRTAGVTAEELNNKILANQGVLAGKGQAFIDASSTNKINEIYLVAHALLETGNGKSTLSKGIKVNKLVNRDKNGNPILDENGEPTTTDVPEKTVYNVFGVGAYDRCPDECGAERAYTEGWFSLDAAIKGGAQYISNAYINNSIYKQDTLYKMRWNPALPGTHQYATDIGWAVKQVNRIHQMYQLLDSYTLYYDVPVFKK